MSSKGPPSGSSRKPKAQAITEDPKSELTAEEMEQQLARIQAAQARKKGKNQRQEPVQRERQVEELQRKAQAQRSKLGIKQRGGGEIVEAVNLDDEEMPDVAMEKVDANQSSGLTIGSSTTPARHSPARHSPANDRVAPVSPSDPHTPTFQSVEPTEQASLRTRGSLSPAVNNTPRSSAEPSSHTAATPSPKPTPRIKQPLPARATLSPHPRSSAERLSPDRTTLPLNPTSSAEPTPLSDAPPDGGPTTISQSRKAIKQVADRVSRQSIMQSSIDQANAQISQMRAEMAQLRTEMSTQVDGLREIVLRLLPSGSDSDNEMQM